MGGGMAGIPPDLKSESAVRIGELLGLGIAFAMGVHGDGSDLLLLDRTVGRTDFRCRDGIHHIHAGSDLAEGGVLAIQMLGILVHDKELGAGRVGGRGTGHGKHATLVLEFILHAVKEEFALDAVAWAAHAGAIRATALDHEAGDHTVEDQTVIVIMFGQIDEIGNALGSRRSLPSQ